MLSKILLSILPGIVFCFIFYLLDKNKSKKKLILLIILFLLGGIGAYITHRFEWHFGSYFPKFKDSNMWQILIYAIFGVAIFEEGYKWLFTFIGISINRIKNIFEVIVYSVFCSAGLATFENLLYYNLSNDISVSIIRMIVTVPSHICNAIVMGLFLGLGYISNNKYKKIGLYILAFVMATVVHALYNWFIYKPGLFDSSVHYIYYVLLCIVCIYICIVVRNKE